MDNMTIQVKDGEFALSGKLITGRLSKSGKSKLLLTTSGNQEIAEAVVDGRPVTVSVNVYQKQGG